MTDLKGKNIIVTGASGGIGNSIIEKLSHAGANILASGTRIEKLDELKDKFVNIKTLKFDCKCSRRIFAGTTCPPDPPVEINIFFIQLFFFLLNLKLFQT